MTEKNSLDPEKVFVLVLVLRISSLDKNVKNIQAFC